MGATTVRDVAVPAHRVADRVEQRGEVVGGDVGAEYPVDLGDPDLDRPIGLRQLVGAFVDRAGVHGEVRTRLAEQFDEPGDGGGHPVGVDASFEAG